MHNFQINTLKIISRDYIIACKPLWMEYRWIKTSNQNNTCFNAFKVFCSHNLIPFLFFLIQLE